MRKRVTELKKAIQPYLPQQRTNSELYVKVRQCIADFDTVAGYLRELESWAKQAEKRSRKREGLLQELVAQLGTIRESFT